MIIGVTRPGLAVKHLELRERVDWGLEAFIARSGTASGSALLEELYIPDQHNQSFSLLELQLSPAI